MTNRRSFLLGLTTALAAPAVVRAESLMKIWVPPAPKLVVPDKALVDHAGHLFDTSTGRVVGWWTQKAGRMTFNYVNPDQVAPENGVWNQSGSGLSFSKMIDVLDAIGDVAAFYPTPVAS